MNRTIAFLLVALAFLSSCKENSTDPVAIDKSYFPLETGKYIIYDVDSLGYWAFADSVIHSEYQVKEEIDSAFIDNAGNQAFRIIRSRRDDETSPWVATDAWSANLTDNTAEKVEENLRFVKQHFPILLDKEWLGNVYISNDSALEWLEGWEYRYTEIHRPATISGVLFDSTITVTQRDEENVIEKTLYEEKYARNVGLIYKIEEQLETQPSQPVDGFSITMTVREFN